MNRHFAVISSDATKKRHCKAQSCRAKFSATSSHRTHRRHWLKEHGNEDILRKTIFIFHDKLDMDRLVKLIIAQLEYRLVDKLSFRKFCQAMDKSKTIISRQTVSSITTSRKKTLQGIVRSRLSNIASRACTFDLWSTNKGGRGFGCITGHFIDDTSHLRSVVP